MVAMQAKEVSEYHRKKKLSKNLNYGLQIDQPIGRDKSYTY